MSRRSGNAYHVTGGLMSFVLVAVFAVMSMLLVAVGIQAYQGIIGNAEGNQDLRSSMSFVANQIRTADISGNIQVSEYGGASMLTIGQDELSPGYELRVYLYQGALMEQLYDSSDDFNPEYGDVIANAQGFNLRWADKNLLEMSVTTAGGQEHVMDVAIRSETQEEGANATP